MTICASFVFACGYSGALGARRRVIVFTAERQKALLPQGAFHASHYDTTKPIKLGISHSQRATQVSCPPQMSSCMIQPPPYVPHSVLQLLMLNRTPRAPWQVKPSRRRSQEHANLHHSLLPSQPINLSPNSP